MINFCLPAERLHCRVWDTYGRFWNNITLVCIAWFELISELQRKICISNMPQCLAWMNKHNSCKRRAECLRHSLVIVHTEHGQWQAFFIRKKSVCLAEVSVMEQILCKFHRNPGGTEHAQTVCTRLFFLHPHTRVWEQGVKNDFTYNTQQKLRTYYGSKLGFWKSFLGQVYIMTMHVFLVFIHLLLRG